MADLADSLLPQLRASIAAGNLQGALADTQNAARGDRGRHPDRDAPTARSIAINGADSVTGTIDLATATLRGQDVHSTSEFADGKLHSWAATKVNARSVVFATLDRSGAEALGDLARAIPIGLLAVLLIGGPLAYVLSRSVTGPAASNGCQQATAGVARAGLASRPVPVDGPREVRELTEHFNAMTAELQAVREREEQLLANLRHDLRTPLTVISGFAGAIADGTATGPEAAQAGGTDRRGGRPARAPRRRARHDGAPADRVGRAAPGADRRRALLDQTAERFRARAAARKGSTLSVIGATAAGSPTDATPPLDLGFSADRVAVDRILGNLIENALAVVPSPGGHVWLEARGSADWVTLLVSDDGPGFPPGEHRADLRPLLPGRPGPERVRAAASAWRSCASWPGPTAARPGPRASPPAAPG